MRSKFHPFETSKSKRTIFHFLPCTLDPKRAPRPAQTEGGAWRDGSMYLVFQKQKSTSLVTALKTDFRVPSERIQVNAQPFGGLATAFRASWTAISGESERSPGRAPASSSQASLARRGRAVIARGPLNFAYAAFTSATRFSSVLSSWAGRWRENSVPDFRPIPRLCVIGGSAAEAFVWPASRGNAWGSRPLDRARHGFARSYRAPFRSPSR
jgi:hypothetical protein